MHPDYEKYRVTTKVGFKQFPIRLQPELMDKIKTFAELEGDNTQALIIEGIARVIEDRIANPNPEAVERLMQKRASLMEEVAAIDAMMPTFEQKQ
jgi:hypothetical protein